MNVFKHIVAGCVLSVCIGNVVVADAVDAKSGKGPSLTQRAKKFAEMLRQPGPHERLNSQVRGAFRDSVKDVSKATVRILSDGRYKALGAIVDKDGYVLTKYSELNGQLSCKLQSGVVVDAELVGFDQDHDLAMLRIEKLEKTKALPVVRWATGGAPELGSWLATPSLTSLPVSVGVVSAATRRIPAPPALLGVVLADDDEGPRIAEILPGGAAEKGGLQVADIVTKVNGGKIRSIRELQRNVMGRRPGTIVELLILREGDPQRMRVKLGRMSDAIETQQRMAFQKKLGGPISERREDFPAVLQHDSVLRPEDCGGPLVNLDGEVVGLNIARASRICSFALPTEVILPVLAQLRKGKGADLLKRRKDLNAKKQELTKSVKTLEERVHQHTLDKKTAEATIKRLEKELAAKDDADKRRVVEAAKKRIVTAEKDRIAAGQEVKQAKAKVEEVDSELTSLLDKQ